MDSTNNRITRPEERTDDISFEGTEVAPEGTEVSFERTEVVEEGTEVSLEGTEVAGEETEVYPEGTDVAIEQPSQKSHTTRKSHRGSESKSEAGVILPDGSYQIDGVHYTGHKKLASGSEAQMTLVKDDSGTPYVLKLYKCGHNPNEKIYPSLEKLTGKGYVADIYSHGTIDDRFYELMEYFRLGSAAKLNVKGNADAISKILLKTALCIDACHKAGFMHLDIKPANILIRETDNYDCVLCDFGISEVLEGDIAMFPLQQRTPTYAAPELYLADKSASWGGVNYSYLAIGDDKYNTVTKVADYYSLGMTALSLWAGEASIRKDERDMLRSKIAESVSIPPDMPKELQRLIKGLLIKEADKRWGIEEIKKHFGGQDVAADAGKRFSITYSQGKIAKSPEDLAAYMLEDIKTAEYLLYSGQVSKWFNSVSRPDLSAKIDEFIEKRFRNNRTLGLFATVHLLNDFYDIKLDCDIKSPYYAMTKESIAAFLNKVYIWHFVEERHSTPPASFEVCDLIVDSLKPSGLKESIKSLPYDIPSRIIENPQGYRGHERYEDKYLHLFFISKGNRFLELDEWCKKCIENPPFVSTVKNGATINDSDTIAEILFMYIIKCYGHTPQYTFHDSGTIVSTVADLQRARENKAEALNRGLRGWLAVQYFADCNKKFDNQYDYERSLHQYLLEVGSCDKTDPNFLKFCDASKRANSLNQSQKFKRRWRKIRRVLQIVLASILVLLPAIATCAYYAASIIETSGNADAKLTETGVYYISFGVLAFIISWIALGRGYGKSALLIGLGTGVAVYYLTKWIGPGFTWVLLILDAGFLITFVIIFFFKFRIRSNSQNVGFEQLVLEPLCYAFSIDTDRDFDSSLESFGRFDDVAENLNYRFYAIIASVVIEFAFFLGIVGVPYPEKFDTAFTNTIERIGSYFVNNNTEINDTVQEMPNE